jgi:hypothetical protein
MAAPAPPTLTLAPLLDQQQPMLAFNQQQPEVVKEGQEEGEDPSR